MSITVSITIKFIFIITLKIQQYKKKYKNVLTNKIECIIVLVYYKTNTIIH